MNSIDIEQGTQEWFDERLGRLTASKFYCIMTQPQAQRDREAGKLSRTAESYLIEKVTELLTGESRELKDKALEWGKQYEEEARKMYELERMVTVKQVGFIPHKTIPIIGCSPDGLLEDRGLEIKCPHRSSNFTKYLYGADIPKSYYTQIQASMYITGLNKWDFVVYNPRVKNEKFRLYVKTVDRDEDYIEKIDEQLSRVLIVYENMLKKVDLTFLDVLENKLSNNNNETNEDN